MNRRRLKNFLAKIEKLVKPEKFNIRRYVTSRSRNLFGEDAIKELQDNTCKTAACAVGYLPIFYPKTFRYSGYSDMLIPTYKNSNSTIRACDDSAHYFDLTDDEWGFLFADITEVVNPQFGKGKQGVINRLNHLLEKGL